MLQFLTGRAHRRALIGTALIGMLGVAALAGAFSAGASAHRERAYLTPGDVMLIASGQSALVSLAMLSDEPLISGLRGRQGRDAATAAKPLKLEANARDLDCLTAAIYYEARGEGRGGQAAVAQVVLNRVRHRAFPKTVCGVVYQRSAAGTCQFSFACDGSIGRARDERAWAAARKIAGKALNGAVMPAVGEATHFHTLAVAPSWGPRLLQVTQVGFHVFYRFGGSAGSSSALTGAPRPSGAEEGLLAASDPAVIAQGETAVTPPLSPLIAAASSPIVQTAAPATTPEPVKSTPVAEAAVTAPAAVRIS